MIKKELLDILSCPECLSSVILDDQKVVCTGCGVKYPIKNGVPIMLPEEAETPE